jgi:hypothetical protein
MLDDMTIFKKYVVKHNYFSLIFFFKLIIVMER